MPPCDLTGHAVRQMARRGVNRQDIESALAHETRRAAGEPGTIWIWGVSSSAGRVLKVCVSAYDQNRVITVAWPDSDGEA